MTTRCSDVHETLSAYVDGQERPAESIAARAHLEACAACRHMVDDWASIEAALAIEMDAPPLEHLVRAAPARARPLAAVLAAAAVLLVLSAGAVLAALGTRDRVPDAAPIASRSRRLQPSAPPAATAPSSVPALRETTDPKPSPSPEPTAKPFEGSWQTASRGSNGQLVLTLQLERPSAAAGEPVRAKLTLRNVTKQDVTFTSPARSPIDLVIREPDGTEVYRRSQAEGWERELVERTLAPGEVLAEEVTFLAPEPGGYIIVAQCVCLPEDFRTPPGDEPPAKDPTPSKTYPFETAPLKFASGRQPSP